MRYVKRDKDGQVVAHFANPQIDATETVEDNHDDIQTFVERRRAKQIPTASRFAELAERITSLEKQVKQLKRSLQQFLKIRSPASKARKGVK